MSNPTDTTTNLYQVRQQQPNTAPEDRGRLLGEFETWAAAVEFLRECVKANIENVFISSPSK